MKTACVIPAYAVTDQELATLLTAVDGLFDSIVIVFNDETVRPEREAHLCANGRSKVSALHLVGPLGKAEAVRHGLRYVLDHTDAQTIAQMDAHHKQPPSQALRLLKRLRADAAVDMVVANRYGALATQLETHRATVSGGFSALVRSLTGYDLTDTVCGTRAYRRHLAELFVAEGRCSGYGLELEQLFLASAGGYLVGEEPIDSRPQAPTTSAAKLEDNLESIILHSAAKLPWPMRATLHRALAQVKQRRTLEIDATSFGMRGIYTCTFVGPAEDGEDAYAALRREPGKVGGEVR